MTCGAEFEVNIQFCQDEKRDLSVVGVYDEWVKSCSSLRIKPVNSSFLVTPWLRSEYYIVCVSVCYIHNTFMALELIA